jgi:hypothetical protein
MRSLLCLIALLAACSPEGSEPPSAKPAVSADLPLPVAQAAEPPSLKSTPTPMATATTDSANVPLSAAQSTEWPEIKWEDMIPKDWDPTAEFKDLDFSKLQDSDSRAVEALDKLKRAWDNAPPEPSMNGRKGRIAGFTVPLEHQGDKVTEFLIVPYFGACIHVPPPPANQIIHAKSARPLTGVKMMMPIWTYGAFSVQHEETQWGVSGYRMTVDKVMPYEMPPSPARK